ncbi:GTP:AMP phosphotransferase, mitochondrial [Gryllus bimaculatus]|nr:GTP:AMP phosphotransferase, mitochondrial [Gryllus bimaculatus]
MKSSLLRALIIGAPASGKGTISNRIVKSFDVQHLSSGDLLRHHILNKTELGQAANKYITEGLLVPDKLIINLVIDELKKLKTSNWLLDGFPRTRNQALELSRAFPVNVVINLIVPYDVIIHRVQQRWIHARSGRIYNTEFSPPKIMGKDDVTGEDLIQRPDDQPEAVKRRLNEYAEIIHPVLEFYKHFNVVHDFHGKTSDEIWPKVQDFLSSIIEPKVKCSSSN